MSSVLRILCFIYHLSSSLLFCISFLFVSHSLSFVLHLLFFLYHFSSSLILSSFSMFLSLFRTFPIYLSLSLPLCRLSPPLPSASPSLPPPLPVLRSLASSGHLAGPHHAITSVIKESLHRSEFCLSSFVVIFLRRPVNDGRKEDNVGFPADLRLRGPGVIVIRTTITRRAIMMIPQCDIFK